MNKIGLKRVRRWAVIGHVPRGTTRGKVLVKNCFPVRLSRKKRLDILINVYVIYKYLRVETRKLKWKVIHQIVA